MIDDLLELWSDGASLMAFDPEACRGTDPRATYYPFHEHPLVQSGVAVMLQLPGDGSFRIRITDQQLSDREKALVHSSVESLGLVVSSGRVYVSGMDVPGEHAATLEAHGAGAFIGVPAGEYDVSVHLIRIWKLPEHEQADLPSYVLRLQPRSRPFAGVRDAPRLLDITDADVDEITGRSR